MWLSVKQRLKSSDPGLAVPEFRVCVFGFAKYRDRLLGCGSNPGLRIFAQSFQAWKSAFGRVRAHSAAVDLFERRDSGMANHRLVVRQHNHEGFDGRGVAQLTKCPGRSLTHVAV